MAKFIIEDAPDSPSSGGRYVIEDAPKAIGAEAQGSFLREELKNADWGTRNIAAFGTALSDLYQRGKQLVGQGDRQAIEANQIMRDEAPIGGAVGKMAVAAAPFGLAGNGIGAAMKVGAGLGFAEPVGGEQTLGNIAKGTAQNTIASGVLAGAGQKLSNMAGDAISRKLGDLALRKSQNVVRDKTINEALDAGLVVPPSSVKPTAWNVAKESVAGKISTAQAASNRNASTIDGLVRRAVGLHDDAPLNAETFNGLRTEAYKTGYKPIADLPAVNWDEAMLKEVAALSPARAGGAVKTPAQAEIDDLIGALTNQKQWTGEQLIGDIKALRDQARVNFRAANGPQPNSSAGDLARAQIGAADALENLAERNAGNPELVFNLRKARKLIAKTHDVEDAVIEGGGTVAAKKLAQMLQRGKPLTDELAVVARFANNFPRAVQPNAQVSGPGVSALRGAAGPMLGMGGAMAGAPLPLAAAAAAYPFVVPPLMRSQLLSRGSQNSLRDLYKLGLPTRMAGRLLQNAPVAGAVLGPNALAQYLSLQP
jgi:hypothetical protein